MNKANEELRANLLDPLARRPWLDEQGRSWINVKRPDGSLTSQPSSIPAKLTKEEWMEVDTAALRIFRSRAPLTAWLLRNGSVFEPKEGTEPISAVHALPLPITHCDVKAGGFSNTLAGFEAAARRVGESVERTLLDGWDGQGSEPRPDEHGCLDKLQLFGLRNCGKAVRFGGNIKASSAIKLLANRRFYGPFVVATDADVNTHDEREAERTELLALKDDVAVIQGMVATPALKPGERVIVQFTPDVVQMVVGLHPTPMQWDEGFKVACLIVPQVRCDFHGNCGIAVKSATQQEDKP